MKLAFTTLGCPQWDFSRVVVKAAEYGFSGIEIRGINGTMRAEELDCFKPENADETKSLLHEHNIKLMGLDTSVSFHDENKYAAAIDEGKKAIDVCHMFEIPFIRVFGNNLAPGDREGTIARVVKGINELCLYAAGKEVMVLLEVHGDFNTIEVMTEVISGAGDTEGFGILWDIAHSDKVYANNIVGFYNVIKPYIVSVHIKDHIRKAGEAPMLCLVGEGDIPIRDITALLERDEYNGYYSFEWEKKWHPELHEPETAFPEYVRFMKSLKTQ